MVKSWCLLVTKLRTPSNQPDFSFTNTILLCTKARNCRNFNIFVNMAPMRCDYLSIPKTFRFFTIFIIRAIFTEISTFRRFLALVQRRIGLVKLRSGWLLGVLNLVTRRHQLFTATDAIFYRHICEQKEIVRQHPVTLSFLCVKINFALHPPFKLLEQLSFRITFESGSRASFVQAWLNIEVKQIGIINE